MMCMPQKEGESTEWSGINLCRPINTVEENKSFDPVGKLWVANPVKTDSPIGESSNMQEGLSCYGLPFGGCSFVGRSRGDYDLGTISNTDTNFLFFLLTLPLHFPIPSHRNVPLFLEQVFLGQQTKLGGNNHLMDM